MFIYLLNYLKDYFNKTHTNTNTHKRYTINKKIEKKRRTPKILREISFLMLVFGKINLPLRNIKYIKFGL